MSKDFNTLVLEAVAAGMTYSRAARVFNTTNSVIAGIVDRADRDGVVAQAVMPTPDEVRAAVHIPEELEPLAPQGAPITQCMHTDSEGFYCHREPEPDQPFCARHSRSS